MDSAHFSVVPKTDASSRAASMSNTKRQSCVFLLYGVLLQKSLVITDAFPQVATRSSTTRSSPESALFSSPFYSHLSPYQDLISRPRSGLYAHRISHAGSSPDTPDSAIAGKSKHRNSDFGGKPGWRRRVFSRLRRKRSQDSIHAHSTRGSSSSTSTSRNMNAVGTMDEIMRDQRGSFAPFIMKDNLDQFVLDNLEKLSPEQLFRTLQESSYVLDSSGDSAFQPFVPSPLQEILPPIATTNSTASLSVGSTSVLESTATAIPTDSSNSMAVLGVDENQLLECLVPTSQLGAKVPSFEGGPLTCKAVRTWFQNVLANSFTQWATEAPVNMQVRCSPTGSVLWSIMRGELECDARIDFDRIVFKFIRLSGGSLEGSRLALNLLGFTVDKSKCIVPELLKGTISKKDVNDTTLEAISATQAKTSLLWKAKAHRPRYQRQFDLHANDCIITEQDLFESSCVTNGLRNLLARILKRRGIRTSSIEVRGIEILKNGKIACKGQATVLGLIPQTIPFEVRSGIDFNRRGHVVTFPGLEISLSPGVGLFVPVHPTMELDIGHNARLRELSIHGDKKFVKLAASVTITPHHTLKLNQEYTQSSDAYAARFSYDVGRWLTRIGRFSI